MALIRKLNPLVALLGGGLDLEEHVDELLGGDARTWKPDSALITIMLHGWRKNEVPSQSMEPL